MDAVDKHVIKTALKTVAATGGTGIKKPALLDQIDLAAGYTTTSEQREAAFSLMRDRGWITFYMEPIWHDRRWTITERGMTAMEGM